MHLCAILRSLHRKFQSWKVSFPFWLCIVLVTAKVSAIYRLHMIHKVFVTQWNFIDESSPFKKDGCEIIYHIIHIEAFEFLFEYPSDFFYIKTPQYKNQIYALFKYEPLYIVMTCNFIVWWPLWFDRYNRMILNWNDSPFALNFWSDISVCSMNW